MQNLKRVYVSYGDKLANVPSLFASFSGADTDGYRTTLAQMKTLPQEPSVATQAPRSLAPLNMWSGKPAPTNGAKAASPWRAALDLPQ